MKIIFKVKIIIMKNYKKKNFFTSNLMKVKNKKKNYK